MKYLVAPLILAQAAAFSVVGPSSRAQSTQLAMADYEPMEGESKINLKVRTADGYLGMICLLRHASL